MTILFFLKPSVLFNGPQDAVDAMDSRRKKEKFKLLPRSKDPIRDMLRARAEEETAVISIIDQED